MQLPVTTAQATFGCAATSERLTHIVSCVSSQYGAPFAWTRRRQTGTAAPPSKT